MTKSEKRLEQEYGAKFCIKNFLPYGMFRNAENGKVLFFNREYEVMEFGGKREFDCSIDLLDIDFSYVCDKKFLIPRDGTVYVGKIYLLYTDENPPYTFVKRDIAEYFHKLTEVMWTIVDTMGNAFNNGTTTDDQIKKLQVLMDRHFINKNNKRS